jgi:hypothetical protein
VTYVQVKRLVAAPPEVTPAPRASNQHISDEVSGARPGDHSVATPTLPDVRSVLDAAFGPEQR